MLVQLAGYEGYGAQGSALITKEPSQCPFQQMLGMVGIKTGPCSVGLSGISKKASADRSMILHHILNLNAGRGNMQAVPWRRRFY